MTHLALGFAIAHLGVTSGIVGPRTMGHLDDLLAGLDVTLRDEILDRIDQIVPPGTDVGTLDQATCPRPSNTRSFAAGLSMTAPLGDHTRPTAMQNGGLRTEGNSGP
jgi:hypothetical protein